MILLLISDSLIISTLSIFFSRILDRCVFPDPLDPNIFSHLPGQFGQLSINLYAEKLL